MDAWNPIIAEVEQSLQAQQNTSNKTEGWTMVVWLICLICVGVLVGCDGQAAENTAKAEQEAHERFLIGMPCMYVCQSHYAHEGCTPKNTRCVKSADMTNRK